MDPYKRNGSSLETPARRIFLITPDDNNDLARTAKALRIWNPTTADATISLVTDFGDAITLDVPAGALIIEPVVTDRVRSTGTTAALKIHGYSD